jgi:hypothetical protein
VKKVEIWVVAKGVAVVEVVVVVALHLIGCCHYFVAMGHLGVPVSRHTIQDLVAMVVAVALKY